MLRIQSEHALIFNIFWIINALQILLLTLNGWLTGQNAVNFLVTALADHSTSTEKVIQNSVFKSVGCDMDLGSKEKVDRCGVCKGDGGSCREKFVAELRNPAAVFVNVTDRKANRTKGFHTIGNATTIINATVAPNMTDAGSRSMNVTNKNTANFETPKAKSGNVNNSTGKNYFINI